MGEILARRCVGAICCLVICAVNAISGDQAAQQQMQLHFERAQAALKSNLPDAAIQEFRAILALDPKNADARANLGVIAFVQGDYAKASDELRQALKLQPSLWKAQAMLGMSADRLGQFRDAHILLEKSFPHLQDTKIRIQAGIDLAELDYREGEMLKAVQVLLDLEHLDPANVDVLYAAYRVFSTLAGHAMDGIALTHPDSARMHQIMAEHLVNRGDIPAALTQYRMALQADPNSSGAHFELGEALLFSSKSEASYEDARKEFEASLALNHNDAKAESWLGQIFTSKQDMPAALEHYSRAVGLDPNDVDARVGLGKVLIAMGQLEGALSHLLEAVRLDPLNAAAHYRLASVYRELGRTADAHKELAAFSEIQQQKKRILAVYQQMRESPSTSEVRDPDVPQ